jgi:hypothetical protein
MKILIILIYIIIFILLIKLSINIEKYKNIEINKLDSVNMYGNLIIKTKKNNFNNINTICIKNQCIDINKFKELPYKKGNSGECTKEECTKICRCPYGKEATDDECTVDQKEICVSCGKNYRYDYRTKTCSACEGGKIIDVENHNRTVCCLNIEKYNLDNTCSQKVCKCDNGEGDNENCENEDLTKCKTCNRNYYLNNENCLACEANTFTNHGNRDRKCCPKGQHYDFRLDECMINKCICEGGYSIEGEQCEIHGSEKCLSCKGGKSGEYYAYLPSAIEGNKCINCNSSLTLPVDTKYIYSDKHRIKGCCSWGNKYNEDSGKCEDVGKNPNNLCRDGETFNFSGMGYCECPASEIFNLEQDICKEI